MHRALPGVFGKARHLSAVALAAIAASAIVSAEEVLLDIDHWDSLALVDDPQMSPDGEWVAYTTTIPDLESDEYVDTLWMVNWKSEKQVQLTQGPESASSPRWSPDGNFLTFLASGKGSTSGTQVWIFDRDGGNARQLTRLNGSIVEHVWSPDSAKLALVASLNRDQDFPGSLSGAEGDEKPIVIDRYQFKRDESGYVTGSNREKIYIYDIASAELAELTVDDGADEHGPVWSPDGKNIAFHSNRDPDADRTANTDIFLAEARRGADLYRLTSYNGQDEGPLAFSHDGKLIAYLQGPEPKYWLYHSTRLAVIPAAGGTPIFPASNLDRDGDMPTFAADSRYLEGIITDDRFRYLARVSLDGGKTERITAAMDVVHAYSRVGQRTALLLSRVGLPAEIFALESDGVRQLTHHNQEWLASLKLGEVEGLSFRSTDGQADIRGLITKPPRFESNKKYPAILLVHGGPYMQNDYAFDFERQYFAAKGYVVIQVNYRGSTGRGLEFGQSIFADWGNKEVADVIAGVDHVIQMGVADPERLAVAGWSQGGIITNYVIARDSRFRAAVSGAGAGNQLALYGSDEYTFMYDNEFKPPWEDPDRWMQLSYPFFKANRIRTPTLYIGGEKDFNVPITGGEQMYQALKSLGIPTQLVIYPGEYHTFTRPSFDKDVFERYAAWFDEHLQADRR